MGRITIRRAVAAASATAMAGAALVVGGAAVASADEAKAEKSVGGFNLTRTVTSKTPTYGEIVTLTTQLDLTSGGWLLYKLHDHHPECMEYVDGTARWQASGGSITTSGNSFESRPGYMQIHSGTWRAPLWLAADYRVNCDAGKLNTGGAEFSRNNLASMFGDRNMGPEITVLRKGTNVFLDQPVSPEVNQAVLLTAKTTNVPDNSQVDFLVDGVSVGKGTVTNGIATQSWTSATAGTKTVRAVFGQTNTHAASSSTSSDSDRTVVVSQANVASSIVVTASANPKVGVAGSLTATVDPHEAGGTVTFKEGGESIGVAAVGVGGVATLPWIPGTSGARTIDAEFSGRAGVNPSHAAPALSVTVAEADSGVVGTSTTLDAIDPTQAGTEIALTARLEPSNAAGSVEFFDGSTSIGTSTVVNGVAIFTWAPSTAGERTVRAVFTGAGHASSQAVKQVVILAAPVDPGNPNEPGEGGEGGEAGSGSLGSLTGSGDAGNTGGLLGSLSNFGS